MREIKFRAWCNGEMKTPAVWINSENLPCYSLCSNPKAPLMQYTGLKDANGVEIYEGDIIETSGLEFSREVVKHKVGNSIQTSGHGCSDTKATSGYSIGGYYGGPDKIEVIGNIHENPELLP